MRGLLLTFAVFSFVLTFIQSHEVRAAEELKNSVRFEGMVGNDRIAGGQFGAHFENEHFAVEGNVGYLKEVKGRGKDVGITSLDLRGQNFFKDGDSSYNGGIRINYGPQFQYQELHVNRRWKHENGGYSEVGVVPVGGFTDAVGGLSGYTAALQAVFQQKIPDALQVTLKLRYGLISGLSGGKDANGNDLPSDLKLHQNGVGSVGEVNLDAEVPLTRNVRAGVNLGISNASYKLDTPNGSQDINRTSAIGLVGVRVYF